MSAKFQHNKKCFLIMHGSLSFWSLKNVCLVFIFFSLHVMIMTKFFDVQKKDVKWNLISKYLSKATSMQKLELRSRETFKKSLWIINISYYVYVYCYVLCGCTINCFGVFFETVIFFINKLESLINLGFTTVFSKLLFI